MYGKNTRYYTIDIDIDYISDIYNLIHQQPATKQVSIKLNL
jgi:hypothetical protein